MKTNWPELCFAGEGIGIGRHTGSHSWHSHRCLELVLVTAGHCHTRFRREGDLNCPKGTLLITPPNVEHSQFDTPECNTIFIGLENGDFEFDSSLRIVDCAGCREIAHYLKLLFLRFLDGNPRQETGALLAALMFSLQSRENCLNQSRYLHPSIQAASVYIEANFCRKLSLKEIAEHCNISVPRLTVLFREQFHCSIGDDLLTRRLGLARTLLCNWSLSIDDVAEQSGFANANYLIRCFRRRFGCTPGEFRRSRAVTVEYGSEK